MGIYFSDTVGDTSNRHLAIIVALTAAAAEVYVQMLAHSPNWMKLCG